MKVKELHVQDRLAIAVTSMQRCGEKIYLGLTGGANILAEYDTSREELLVHHDVFPWIGQRRYCSKIHNALGALPDGSLVLGEGNHFTWDGIPVTVNYFNHELPESMLQRKRDQAIPRSVIPTSVWKICRAGSAAGPTAAGVSCAIIPKNDAARWRPGCRNISIPSP